MCCRVTGACLALTALVECAACRPTFPGTSLRAAYVPPATNSLNPYPHILANLTNTLAPTHFDLFKNSPFSSPESTCHPLNESAAVGTSPSIATSHSAQAKSQSDFCSHLRVRSNQYYVVLPTSPTAAAFLPNWSSILAQIGTVGWKVWALRLVPGTEIIADHLLSNLTGMTIVLTAIWDICQTVFLGYSIVKGVLDPPYATWLNPFVWLTPVWYIVLLASFRRWLTWIMVSIALAELCLAFFTVFVRLTPEYNGTVSYNLLPTFPVDSLPISPACQAFIEDPQSNIYRDTLVSPNLYLQIIQCILILSLWPIITCLNYDESNVSTNTNVQIRQIFLCSILVGYMAWQIVGLVWMAMLANQGSPFMWDAVCNVIVIGMSPRLGYWDADVRESYGYVLMALRTTFGLCESTFSSENKTQLIFPE
jgi:hypothetical protein